MKQANLLGLTKSDYCIFCKISRKEEQAYIVYEDEHFISFLDNRPLFPGHCLLIPKTHVENFHVLRQNQVGSLFQLAQIISKSVERAMNANGTFVAVNNKVSQSVPHLHVHISPRRYKDGLKGFFWPRNPYQSAEHMNQVQKAIRENINLLLAKN